jgi:drug/metabolite transporter (DMT)-like permease
MPLLEYTSRRSAIVGVAFVLISATGFSAKAIFAKLLYAYHIDPITVIALRMIFSLPFFLLLAWWSSSRADSTPVSRQDWLVLCLLGFSGYYLSSYLDFLGLQYISAGLERLILFLTPTMVVLFSAVLFKRKVKRHHLAALALSYGGIALVFIDNVRIASDRGEVYLGGALVFASALMYAFYLIASGEIIPRVGPSRFAAYASTVSCAFCIAQFLLTRDLSVLVLPMPAYVMLGAMAVFSTVLPVWWMAEGVRRIGSNQAAMISSIGPVATISLGVIFLNEPLTVVQVIGAALVLAGVILVSRRAEAAKSA